METTNIETTLQEIFDRVATHLLEQNAYSITPDGTCAYHGDNGCKCSVGCLIKDEAYDSAIEGLGVEHKLVRVALSASGIDLEEYPYTMLGFLEALRRIHDNYASDDWPEELGYLALEWGLSYSHIPGLEKAV
jgi:hypothetical protein